ncbi:RNA polymerase sigma factor [Aquimarina latercula]|uniref:RNA polymerase sigma factor n=1 Tax=Aquimarina latercula TaxID=987 RepID=UPI0004234702|nr:RNA polymerase sigma factor [Aquimarina latercula]
MENPFLKEYSGDTTDIQLVNEAKSGNKKSLEFLVLKHQPYIYNIAWKMVKNPTDAEDLTQEVNIKVITKLSQFKGESSFRTWLYRIVANHFLMSKRKPAETVLDSFDTMERALSNTPDVALTALEQEENKKVIREMNYMCMSGMLLCLTKEQRITFILGEMFNADHTIGSEILGISKSNFRKRLSRARADIFSFMNNKCGLVNKNNPCRCHKKVTYAIKGRAIDSKNLLFNREEYSEFRNLLKPQADTMLDYVDDKYAQLYQKLPYKNNFDKRTFLEDIVNDEHVKKLMNLN